MSSVLSQRLKLLRRESGLTQLYVASYLDISNTTLSQYESGKRMPCFEVLCSLAEIYGCTADYLLGLTENKGAQASNSITPDELAQLDKLKREQPELFSQLFYLPKLPPEKIQAFGRLITAFTDYVSD